MAARAVGHYEVASRLFDRAEGPLRARGLLGQLARNLCVVADLRLDLGEWDRAAAALAEFAPLSAAAMSPSHRATALATTAKVAALRGDSSTALDLVSEIEHSAAARSGSRYLARAQIVRGIACISSDKPLEAYVALSRVFEPADPSHHHREQFDALTYLAEAAAHCGRHRQAREVAERMQLVADGSGSPALLTHVAYARAVLAPDDSAERMFLAGLTSDSARWPWPRARIQLAYGGWLRRQQRITQSRRPLQDALSALEHLGATQWANQARNELDAAGAPSEPPESVSAPNLLSTQETKIARLASQGLSNREIGEQLNVSPRTVSSHLYPDISRSPGSLDSRPTPHGADPARRAGGVRLPGPRDAVHPVPGPEPSAPIADRVFRARHCCAATHHTSPAPASRPPAAVVHPDPFPATDCRTWQSIY